MSEGIRGSSAGAGVAAGERRILLAEPRGFCAGVVRAIETVQRALDLYGPPVYVRKQIVHNHHIVRMLEARGARFVDAVDKVPEGALCLFSAHGVSPAVRREAEHRELRTIDATCPLVAKVHQEARRFARSGRILLLVGHADHEEVEGTYGEAPGSTIVIESVADVDNISLPRDTPVAYLTQTTLAIDETAAIVSALNQRFSDIAGPASDDICYASQNRQNAVKSIARKSDLVLVVGSRNSSNSVRMVEVAIDSGTPARLVPDPAELDEQWLDGVGVVGVSAGASVPESLVDQLINRLLEIGFQSVQIERTAVEDLTFDVPSAVGGKRVQR